MWDSVALGPNEGVVLRALQFLDPDVERIAVQVSTATMSHPRGGFIVKRKGCDKPVPIGGMGEGMWRMLALAIAITQCQGGVLLIDGIDAGLHYTVMSSTWKFLLNAAMEFDVQVFASTHSHDCVYSLAGICNEDETSAPSVTVQRIEPGKPKSVPYTEGEIKAAAEWNIEVR
ncbi:MAG: AAA family ATPase [Capsulimonadaceae bacterium]